MDRKLREEILELLDSLRKLDAVKSGVTLMRR